MLHRRSATKKVEFERTTKERAPLPGGAHSEAGMTDVNEKKRNGGREE